MTPGLGGGGDGVRNARGADGRGEVLGKDAAFGAAVDGVRDVERLGAKTVRDFLAGAREPPTLHDKAFHPRAPVARGLGVVLCCGLHSRPFGIQIRNG